MAIGVAPIFVDAVANVATFVLATYLCWQLRQLRHMLGYWRWLERQRNDDT